MYCQKTKTQVKATNGDTRLGGEDFTNGIMEVCLSDIRSKYRVSDKDISAKAKRRLWQQCDTAKRTLSSSQKAVIEVENIVDGNDYSFNLTRAKFDEIIAPYVQKSF